MICQLCFGKVPPGGTIFEVSGVATTYAACRDCNESLKRVVDKIVFDANEKIKEQLRKQGPSDQTIKPPGVAIDLKVKRG